MCVHHVLPDEGPLRASLAGHPFTVPNTRTAQQSGDILLQAGARDLPLGCSPVAQSDQVSRLCEGLVLLALASDMVRLATAPAAPENGTSASCRTGYPYVCTGRTLSRTL